MISFNDSCFDELLFPGAPELCWGNKGAGAGDITPMVGFGNIEPIDGFGGAKEVGDIRLSNADRSGLLCVGLGCIIPEGEELNEGEADAKFPKPCCADCWVNPPPVLELRP